MSGNQRTQQLVKKYSHEDEILFTPTLNEDPLDDANPLLEPGGHGVHPAMDCSAALSAWKNIAAGEAAKLRFPLMRILDADRILEMIVRRMRLTPPYAWISRPPDVEASDVPS